MKNKKQMAHVSDFFERVVRVVERARSFVGRTADLTMCITYFEIGRMIVEQEQGGKSRAEYGKGLMNELADHLVDRFGRGFSLSTLKNAKRFYVTYLPWVWKALGGGRGRGRGKSQTMFGFLERGGKGKGRARKRVRGKSQTLFGFFGREGKGKRLSDVFRVSWSHYLVLIRIENPNERAFYELETVRQQWTVRQLQRQYAGSLYERLALSRNKNVVMKLAKEGQKIEKPIDILKSPVVLEFLGLDEKDEFSESELESAIISRLQSFLVEMGTGFLFEGRQRRFIFGEDYFVVDLVFYNRLLQCYVLIDLKTDKITHQDLGQMQMYVNYFDRHVKADHEKPTIGILLCKDKNDSVVELTLPKNSNIYASAYSLYLPDKELLQSKLVEWVGEFEGRRKRKSKGKEGKAKKQKGKEENGPSERSRRSALQ